MSSNSENDSIRVFITGGTFDKDYDMINGRLYFKDTHLPEIFKLGRCTLKLNIRTLMMIDSLDMTDIDRELIRDHCSRCEEQHILITHGTDTMVETATVLASANLEKTIVITGAMIPYKFGSSDGFFNLGNALAFSQVLPHGVYIAMNGRHYRWDNVKKNRQTGFFESIK
jgi:L-asparaginase